MHGKEFEGKLATALGVPYSEMDQRGRKLREYDLLPRGGRGPHAPHIGPEHAAFYLLSCVSRRAVDGVIVAVHAADLRALTDHGERLWHFLAKMFHDRRLNRGESLTIDGDGRFALFEMKADEASFPFLPATECDAARLKFARFLDDRRSSISRPLVIGAGVLDQIAAWVAEGVGGDVTPPTGAGSTEQIERVLEAVNQ